MKLITYITLSSILATFSLKGQSNDSLEYNYKLNYQVGIQYFKSPLIDLSTHYAYDFTSQPEPSADLSLGSEIGYGNSFLIGPKIGFAVNNIFSNRLLLRLNFIDYTNFHDFTLKLRPEIVWYPINRICISYGYNIPLSKIEIANINTHVFTLNYSFYIKRKPKK